MKEREREKQAGAKLCQAQGKSNLFCPWLGHCLLWLTNLVLICQIGLWTSQNLSLKWSVWKVEVSKNNKILGKKKRFGTKRNFGSAKIFVSKTCVCLKGYFEFKKFLVKKF